MDQVSASQSIPSWNHIVSWLKEMQTLRTLTPPGIDHEMTLQVVDVIPR